MNKPLTWRQLRELLDDSKIDLDLPVMVGIDDYAPENVIFNTYRVHEDMGQGDELDKGQLILSWE